jgi:myo-inositol-1-phosphate synthase
MSVGTFNSAGGVIRRFGGQSALAQLLGRRQSTIEHWAATGRIPAHWQPTLMALARKKGISLEAKDFVTAESHVIAPAEGRLGVLIVGLGAVASTFIAGVELIKRGGGLPIGALTQMGTIRLGKRTEKRTPLIKDFVPLARLDQLVFGAWDPIPDNAYEPAVKCGVLDRASHIEPVAGELKEIEPMPAAFDQSYVKRLRGSNVKRARTKREMAEALRQDIRDFKDSHACSRLVVIWCGSTEVFMTAGPAHSDLGSFEAALNSDDRSIAPSMLYAYAALQEGVPFINGAPNLTVDIPALVDLAYESGVPICGKDFKTGQTLVKTVVAPMLKARMLGLRGWYSTNILGNRDGEVLDDPDSFRTKEESKLGVLEQILQPGLYPDLYGDIYHKVRINYYPPRGDSKEGWDNLDIFGWLGYPMQMKIDFLCRDSILAAPLVLDLILFTDLAQRAGLRGIQEWLSFYFKSPQHASNVYAENDLFIQQTKLKNTLRWLMGEEQITHLGMEYYQDV